MDSLRGRCCLESRYLPVWMQIRPDGIRLCIRVVPRAGRNAIQGQHGDALKVRLQAPPVEGQANAALVRFLAEQLDIPVRFVGLEAGARGRTKRVRVTGITGELVAARLQAVCAVDGKGQKK